MAIARVAVIGTGLIGASWAAWFLARGLRVTAWDPAPNPIAETVAAHWPILSAMGLSPGADPANLRVCATMAEALDDADFVQENGPERLDAKQALFAAMAEATPAHVVLASSSSTLAVSDVQPGCRHPERIVLGHPFNPPHLIPLVEVVGGRLTSADAIDTAMDFYRQVGKHPIRLRKEMVGHIANRLQAALWREAFHLLLEGVADVADIDAAISHGPGLRWALLGPFLNLHLAGGAGGIDHAMVHLGPAKEAMWADLGHVTLDPETVRAVTEAVRADVASRPMPDVIAARDEGLAALLRMKAGSGLP